MSWGERTVEVPWFLDKVKAGNILDIGCAESCYTHELIRKEGTTALVLNDIRNFSAHEDNKIVSCVVGDSRKLSCEELQGPFDNVLCISTLEHIALEAYDQKKDYTNHPYTAQLEALDHMMGFLKEDGQLVLTVPYGAYEHGGWVIVYNKETIDKIKSKYKVVEETYFTLTDREKDIWENVPENRCPLKGMDHWNGHMRATSCACFILKN
jgi:SAM-dependent methyltransferase